MQRNPVYKKYISTVVYLTLMQNNQNQVENFDVLLLFYILKDLVSTLHISSFFLIHNLHIFSTRDIYCNYLNSLFNTKTPNVLKNIFTYWNFTCSILFIIVHLPGYLKNFHRFISKINSEDSQGLIC